MRTIKIKDVGGELSPVNPLATIGGEPPGPIVMEVTDVPDDVDTATVVRLMDRTVDATWLYGAARHSFRFGELGEGRLIR